MIEAMYGIEFISNTEDGGYGVVVLETGRVFGGDSSFVFIGDYRIHDGIVNARVKCTNDRKIQQSIFGEIEAFNLELNGVAAPEEMILKGKMVEDPSRQVMIKLTRRAELP